MDKEPGFTDDQCRRLAAKAQKILRYRLRRLASIVSPKTLLEWNRCLIAAKNDGSGRRAPSRPATAVEAGELVLRMARDNRICGCTLLQGVLASLDHEVGRSAIAKVLKEAGLGFAPERQKETTWKEFLRSQFAVLAAADFFSVEVWTSMGLVLCHAIFLIRLATREVQIVWTLSEPYREWMKQMARYPTDGVDGFLAGCRCLIHDRSSLFTSEFAMILTSVGIESVRLPSRSPNLKVFAERYVRPIKEGVWIG